MEFLDVYDIDRIPQGRTVERNEKMNAGDFRLVVHACIFSSEGKMLIQQRQPWKSFGGKWDVSMGGASITGETSRDAVQRELREELGLDIDCSGLRPSFTMNFENGFDDFYLIIRDVDIDTLQLQPEEVKAVRWASEEEILGLVDSGEFLPYLRSFLRLLFDLRGRPDCFDM